MLIRRELVERAADFNIILDDVSITELSFGKEYTAAVEAKQVRIILKIYKILRTLIAFSIINHIFGRLHNKKRKELLL